jgi:5-amino-6-(5-phospho-D-ribitylamino)uracil phosphatase
MKHLIAIDLDGTLLNNDNTVSNYTIKVIETLTSKGHLIVLATGRPFSSTYDIYKLLNLNTPVITDNGGSIQHPKDDGFAKRKTYIPLHIMHKLFAFSKDQLSSAFFSVGDTIYAYKYNPRLSAIFKSAQKEQVIEAEFTSLSIEPTGMIFLVYTPFMEAFETFIKEQLSNVLSYRFWGGDLKHAVYEIYLKHVSKWSAIHYLLEYYNINFKHAIAFGDGLNDIEMISSIQHGVAMKNALEEVLAISKDVTSSNNHEDGVAKYLNDYFKLGL